MGGQTYGQEQVDALTELNNYMPLVARDISNEEVNAMRSHARRLLHLMQFVSDPELMEKVIQQVSDVGVVKPTALAEGWVGFIDYIITWYISPKTSKATIRALDCCISRLSANFNLMTEHSANLIVRLCHSLSAITREVMGLPLPAKRELYITKQHKYSNAVVFPQFTYNDLPVGHKDLERLHSESSDVGTNCNHQLQLALRIMSAVSVVQQAVGNFTVEQLQVIVPKLLPSLSQLISLLNGSKLFCTLSISCVYNSYIQMRRNPSAVLSFSPLVSDFCNSLMQCGPDLSNTATSELLHIVRGLVESISNVSFELSKLFDGIENLVRSIPAQDVFLAEQYSQMLTDSLKFLYQQQSPDGNAVVTDIVERLVSLSKDTKKYRATHMRLMTFYINILVSVLQCNDGSNSMLYFYLLSTVPSWACVIPATGLSGVQLLKAVVLIKWEASPANPLSHAVQVIESIAIISEVRMKLMDERCKSDISSQLKTYEMMWIKKAVIMATHAGTASGQILTESLWKLMASCLKDEKGQVRHEALLCIEAALAISKRVGLGVHADSCSQTVKEMCTDIDPAVKTLAFEVFCKLSDYFPKSSGSSVNTNRFISTAGSLTMHPIRPRQFSLLIQTMAGRSSDYRNEETLRRIVAELFTLSRSLDQQPKNSLDMKTCVTSAAVRFCVVEKLKTSLGNPAQTFEALEKLLKSIGTRSLMIEENYTLMNQEGAQLLKLKEQSDRWKYEPHLSSNLVLLLLSELEKWIHLVQEGYIMETERHQPVWSNQSTMFFHINKKVCDDYYSRIRIQQVAAGDAVNNPAFDSMLVRSCHLRLLEMLKYVSSSGVQKEVRIRVFFEMEKVLLSNCTVHVRRHQDSEIYGLMKWAEKLVQNHIPEQQLCGNLLWKALQGMTLHASARYEEASSCYESVFMEGAVEHCQLTFIRLVSHHFIDCCTRSMRWDVLDRWTHELKKSSKTLKEGDRKLQFINDEIISTCDNHSGVGCTSTALGLEYAHALSEWESGTSDTCTSIISKCDDKVSKLLLNSSRNSFHSFVPSIQPELFARIRIMRLLVEPTDIRQQLQETTSIHMQLLQYVMESEATEEGLMLGRILSLLQVKGDIPNQSRKFCEATLLLGHKIDRSGLYAATTNDLQWSRAYCASLYQAAETARSSSNRSLASKLLSRLLSESTRDRYLREWAERGTYEINVLKTESSDPQEVRLGIRALAKAGKEGGLTSCKSLVKIHQISEDEETMPAVADTMKVHASQVTSLVMRTLIEQCPTKKEAVSKYAEWCAKTAGSGTRSEAFWSQAITAHVNALSLPTTKDDEPLVDMKLALRVLKLLLRGVSAGFLIDENTVAVIAKTPIRVWQHIIPQLMAHLTLSTPAMHSAVKQVLQRIGTEPLLLLYPLIAALGTSTGPSKLVFQELWSSAAVGDATTIFSATKEFVSELVRITELLDEETASVISGLTQSLSKTLSVFKNFVRSKLGSGNSSKFNLLKKQKFEALLQPLVQVLEKHIEKLTREPSCLQENEFQSEALPKLQKLLFEIKHNTIVDTEGRTVDAAVEEAHSHLLSMFSALYKSLNDNERRPHVLSLPDISPKLSGLNNTEIPVPGTMDLVTIAMLELPIEIVPSKTRPKKLQLWGSDGCRYTFLLKGKEDLSLDERVMQVLRTITVLLGASKAGRQKNLSARSYAVVPLSDRSGIIRFVENVQPIFHIHRQWMKRKVYLECIQKNKKPQKSSFRPIHHFFIQLLPALKEVGISNVGTREDWPTDVLTRVFNKLSSEVPKDLLTKELWCRGLSSLATAPAECGMSDWLHRVKTYSSSLAVMSVVGYIIGLGDRHLDNILMDLDSGEIVHIDYNICFEKGLQLRVPEVVPFRLTPVLHNALGIQGTDGTFSHVCEDTLSVLRSSKDVLLDLLEAFVHDPLVEWTAKRICDPATDGMEVKVSLGVLSTHLDETLPELSDTWSKCSSAMIVLANAVEELRASRYTEVVTTIREKKLSSSCITIDILKIQQEISDIESGKLTEDDLEKAFDDFNATRSDLKDKLQQFEKIQFDCEEAHSIVSANRSLLILPTDPTQEGDMNIAVRLSEESDRAEWSEQSQGAVLQLQNQELRLPSSVNNHRQQASLLADHLAKWADAIEGLEIANSSHNLVYSENNYCNIWVSTYRKLLQAKESFTQDGSLMKSSYEEYESAAAEQIQNLTLLNAATSDQPQYQKQIAPYHLFGGSLDKTQELATDLMSAFFPLQKELEIMESRDDIPDMDGQVQALSAAVSGCMQPKLLTLHAASTVLSDIDVEVRTLLNSIASSKKVHSWEKSMSLPEMEELDDPNLFLHSKWEIFTLFRKAVLIPVFIAEWASPSMGQLKAAVKDKLESCQVLHTAITAIEKLLLNFSGNLFNEIGKAFLIQDESVLKEFEHHKNTGSCGSSVEYSMGVVLLEAIESLILEFNTAIVRILDHFPQPDDSRTSFVSSERTECVKQIVSEVLKYSKEGCPSLFRKHMLHRRTLGVIRTMLSSVLEVVLLDVAGTELSELLGIIIKELALHGSTVAGKLHPSCIRPQHAGLKAQLQDLIKGVCEQIGSPQLHQQLQNGRSTLSSCCLSVISRSSLVFSHSLKEQFKSTGYYQQLRIDIKIGILNYKWLLEPVLKLPSLHQTTAVGTDAMLMVAASDRKQLIDDIESQYLQYRNSIDDLKSRIVQIHQTEDSISETLLNPEIQRLIKVRKTGFADALTHYDQLCQFAKKLVFLEVLRNLSTQNEVVHKRLISDCERSLSHLKALTRTVVAVSHKTERTADLHRKIHTLREKDNAITEEVVSLQELLNALQRKSSAATSGAYAEVIGNKSKYCQLLKHTDGLLTGVVKTLSQFPALRRLHQRVKGLVEAVGILSKQFRVWCAVFDRVLGPEAVVYDDFNEQIEFKEENTTESIAELDSKHSDIIGQLEDLIQLASTDDQIDVEEDDNEDFEEGETQQNHHALNILRRVELKLDGKDNGNTKGRTKLQQTAANHSSNVSNASPTHDLSIVATPLLVSEQVSRIINEAVSPSNLIHMYEGWTAWI